MNKLLTVRVKKSQWYRGKGDKWSRLKISDKNMFCCVGFLAKALGATNSHIRTVPHLNDVQNYECRMFAAEHQKPLDGAYRINDDPDMTDADRIAKLRKLGQRMHVKFVFVP